MYNLHNTFDLRCCVLNKLFTLDLSCSLSQLVRWMSLKAEELGVEIYPGFAASEVLLLIFK